MTGEQYPLSISIKKVFKKMDKKVYFDPEMEIVELKVAQAILTGSDGDSVPTGGGSGEETPGGWG